MRFNFAVDPKCVHSGEPIYSDVPQGLVMEKYPKTTKMLLILGML